MSDFCVDAPPLVIPSNLTLVQFILDHHHPNRPLRPPLTPWFIEEATGRPVFYEEVRSRVYGLANALALDHRIGNDDVVCIFSPNHVDFPIAVWAVHRLGAIASCANPGYMVDELVHQLKASKAKIIITVPASLNIALAAAKEVGIPPTGILLFSSNDATSRGHTTIDESVVKGLQHETAFVEPRLGSEEGKKKVAFLSFSSGTTGRPKPVAISHYAPIANVIQTAVHAGIDFVPKDQPFTPGDVVMGVLPFFHIYDLVVTIHAMLFSGLSLLVVPKFGLDLMLKSIQRFNVTALFVVPPQIVLLCKHPAAKGFDFSRIKFLMSGAAPLTAELNQRVVELMPNAVVGQGYGMTETSTSVAWPPYGVKTCPFGSAGRLMPGVVARIIKPDGSFGRVGERGELMVKSPSNAINIGYIGAPEANKETFVDGWVRTGDEASITSDNWLYIHDRLKELIKVRGFQVAPAEIEGHLLSHPDVRDACVVGIPDEYSGEVPLAFIALSDEAAQRVQADPGEEANIRAGVAKHVADAKIAYKHLVGGVHVVDVIPKNPSGKLLRRILREKAKLLKAPDSHRAKL